MTTMPPSPSVAILDMEKFLSCFDKTQPANLLVYAEKSLPSVDHAFISITQGSNTMVFGFYPKNGFPSNVLGPGIMGNDGGHEYDGKWDLGFISASKLSDIISTTISYATHEYNLGYDNCADFAITILRMNGKNIPYDGLSNGPNTVYRLMPPSAKTNGNAPQTQRNCPLN